MRNLLAVSAAAAVTFAAVGWYLGWYRVQTEPAGDGHRQVTIDINGPKIGADLADGKDKLRKALDNKAAPQPGAAPTPPPVAAPAVQMPPPPSPQQTTQNGPTWNRSAEDGSFVLPAPVEMPAPPSVPPPPPALPPQGN